MLKDLEALVDDRPAALVTLLDGEHAGAKLYVDGEGETGGLAVTPLLDANASREARGLIGEGRSTTRATSARTAPRWAAACASTSPSTPSRRG